MAGFSTLPMSTGYPIATNGVSTSSRVISRPEVPGIAMYSQISNASQMQSTLTRQYSVGSAVESTPVRNAVSLSQYSPRQAQRQSQPVVMLSGMPARELAGQVSPTAFASPQATPRGPAPREISNDFEVMGLRQQMTAMEGLVEDLRQEIGSLQNRLSNEDQVKKEEEVALEKEKAVVIEELRHEIGDQRQELAELQRLRQIIEDQGAEIQELRVKTVELAAANKELETEKAKIEQALEATVQLVGKDLHKAELEPASEANAQLDGQASQMASDALVEEEQVAEIMVAQQIVDDYSQEDFMESLPLEMEKVQTPPTPGRKMRPLRGDAIDMMLQEYLDSRSDFRIAIEKIKPGWYIFGEPISKKLYLKMSGEHLVCRVGGGTKDLVKYLDDYRLCIYDKKEQDIARARVKRISSRERGTLTHEVLASMPLA